MLRQVVNLYRYGRIRTNAPTPRLRQPKLLRQRPELAIRNLLDMVVAHHGKPAKDFFFIQIGAFDGVTDDPIYELVRKHQWSGVLIEPQLEAFELLKKNYGAQPGLQFYNVAIGPHDGEVSLYTRTDGMVQAASLESHLMNKPGRRQRSRDCRQVPCWTFATLLEKAQVPAQVDLLQIDAEGADFEIIRAIDFQLFKPAIIRWEHMVLCERDRNACLELLAQQGYRFILEDGDTTAYLHSQAAAA